MTNLKLGSQPPIAWSTTMGRRQTFLLVMLAIALLTPGVVHAQKTSAKRKAKDPAFQKWMQEVAALPAEKQVTAVMKKMQQLNPGFNGEEEHQIDDNGVVTWLKTSQDSQLTDISPVRALTGLKDLMCAVSKVSDLSPLEGMALTSLHCAHTNVSDLSPLKAMPLTELHCFNTKVSNLTPLKGMPLTTLNCRHTDVSDLAPLKGMALTMLDCDYTKISDLAPLEGMPLQHLGFADSKVSDLTPVKGMPLRSVNCGGTKVRDLKALEGMSLTSVDCNTTAVSDLTPLVGMPLESLYIGNCKITDLSPLADMQLARIRLTPKNMKKGMDALRKLEYLDTVYVQSGKEVRQFEVEEFWQKYDAGEFKK